MRGYFGIAIWAVGASIFPVSIALANCVESNPNERLLSCCLLQGNYDLPISLGYAHSLDYRLKRQGYEKGVGLPGVAKQTSFNLFVSDFLYRSKNINGGSANKSLLSSVAGKQDPNLAPKKGVLVGANLGVSGRYIYGSGKYAGMQFRGSYAHSFNHSIGILKTSAGTCFKKHLKDL